MTLLIAVTAAVISTVIWYTKGNTYRVSALCWMFWGASLMWLVDAVSEYMELRDEYFTPAPADMLNDAFLGISVVVFALVIWLADLLIHDPKGIFRKKIRVSAVKEANENV
ncbi:MAG: hypothetical protein IJ642_12855 [Oscillospiraceae bacterium]|nr:hypothetical protein [Oscillospiraceae bacterium]